MDESTKTMLRTIILGQGKTWGAALAGILVSKQVLPAGMDQQFVTWFSGGILFLCVMAYQWWTSVGKARVESYLKKTTGTSNVKDAVAVAEALPTTPPPQVAAVAVQVQAAKTAVILLLAGVLLLLFLPSSEAQTRKPAPQFTGNLIADVKANAASGAGNGPGGTLSPDQILAGIGKVELVKLKYTLALAKSADNKITVPCWQALVDTVSKAQEPVLDDKGQPMESPDPNLFATVERASQLLQALNTGGAIQIGCGAMLDASKKSVMQLITAVISGNSLGGLLPVLPIP